MPNMHENSFLIKYYKKHKNLNREEYELNQIHDNIRCDKKFLHFPKVYNKCSHAELAVGCGKMKNDYTNDEVWYLNECCQQRLARHIGFIQCILMPYGVQAWPDHGTLLSSLRSAEPAPWDDDADLGVLVRDADDITNMETAYSSSIDRGYADQENKNIESNHLRSNNKQEKMHHPNDQYRKYKIYKNWLNINKDVAPFTIKEICDFLNSRLFQNKYFQEIIIWTKIISKKEKVLGCGVVSKILPSLRVDIIGYKITKDLKLVDIGYNHVHITKKEMNDIFPLQPKCRFHNIPLMCPNQPIKHVYNIGFYDIQHSKNNWKIFSATKYDSTQLKKYGDEREIAKPFWENMQHAAGNFLIAHAKRKKIQKLHQIRTSSNLIPRVTTNEQNILDFDFWINNETVDDWRLNSDSGNYVLFPRNSLSLKWPDIALNRRDGNSEE